MRLSPGGDSSAKLAPAVGFDMGCASVGSRVSAGASAKAVIAAHEAGVSGYDVALARGLGQAEAELGQFLQGRRETVSVATKVGVAPPARPRVTKQIFTLGCPVFGRASGMRGAFRRIPTTRNRHVPLDPGLVEALLSRSLKRLETDCVYVYVVHDPLPEDVRRDDIFRARERLVERGQARVIAAAGSSAACRAALEAPEIYDVLQMSVAHFREDRARFAGSGKTIVLHSVFGVGGALDQAGKTEARGAAAERLLAEALDLNPRGVVLASMVSPAHLAANLGVARAVDPSRRASPRRASA